MKLKAVPLLFRIVTLKNSPMSICIRICCSLILFITAYPSLSIADSIVDHIEPKNGNLNPGKGMEIFLKPENKVASLSISPGGPYVEKKVPLHSAVQGVALNKSKGVITLTSKGLFSLSKGVTAKGIKVDTSLVQGAHILRMKGDDMYVAGKTNGLVQMRLNKEGGFSFVSQYKPLHGVITDVFIADKRILLVIDRTRILFLNMNRGAGRKLIGQYNSTYEIYRLYVTGRYCFIAGGEAGVIQLDIKNSQSVIEISSFNTSGIAGDLVVIGDNVLVADGRIGLTVLSISKNRGMEWLTSLPGLGFVDQVRNGKESVFVKSRDSIITVVDISKPKKPKQLYRFYAKEEIVDFEVVEGMVVAAVPYSALWVEFPGKDLPIITNDGVNLGGSRRMFLRNDIAYVADWFSGLHLYHVNNPSNPTLISNFHTPGSPKGVFVDGNYAYVGDDDHGLQIVDISKPRDPFLVSHISLPGLAYTMSYSNGNLFVAGHRGGFNVVDVSEPENPSLIGLYDTDGKVWDLEANGDYLYVADDNSGLLIFDVATPQLPIKVAQFNPGGFAEDVLIQENVAFVAFFDKGVYVLDITDPTHPTKIAQIKLSGTARGLFIENNLLYVAGWKAGLFVYDLEDITIPKYLGSFDTDGAVWGVHVRDGYAYVLDWWGGFKVLDVSSPSDMRQVGDYHGQGTVKDVEVKGNYAYIAKGAGGFQVFDINNPLFPVWVAGVDTPGEAVYIDLSGRYASVALSDGGAVIIDIEDPFEPRQVALISTKGSGKIAKIRNNTLYLFDDQVGVIIAELQENGGVIERSIIKKDVQDICFGVGDDLFVAHDSFVDHIDVSIHYRPVIKSSFKMKGRPSLVRLHKGELVVYEERRGITFFQLKDKKAEPVAFIPLKNKVLDISFSKDDLFVTVEGGGLMVFEKRDGGRFVLIQQYNPGTNYTRLAVSKQWVFLAGSDFLRTSKIIPKVGFTQGDSSVTIIPNDTTPPGLYSVQILNTTGQTETLNNVLHVGVASSHKKSFTKEEYQKVLKERIEKVRKKKGGS